MSKKLDALGQKLHATGARYWIVGEPKSKQPYPELVHDPWVEMALRGKRLPKGGKIWRP